MIRQRAGRTDDIAARTGVDTAMSSGDQYPGFEWASVPMTGSTLHSVSGGFSTVASARRSEGRPTPVRSVW